MDACGDNASLPLSFIGRRDPLLERQLAALARAFTQDGRLTGRLHHMRRAQRKKGSIKKMGCMDDVDATQHVGRPHRPFGPCRPQRPSPPARPESLKATMLVRLQRTRSREVPASRVPFCEFPPDEQILLICQRTVEYNVVP